MKRFGPWIAGVALAGAACCFLVRGPWAALGSSSDLVLIYAASHTWLGGGNPYDPRDQAEAIERTNPDGGYDARPLISLYPPPTFVVMAPFSAGTWSMAKLAWIAASLAAFAWLLVAAPRFSGMRPLEVRGICLVVVLLLFGPGHSTIRLGQLGLVAVALVVLAVMQSRGGRDAAAGALLALAAALKPQIAGLFVLLFVARGQWRAVGAFAVTLAAIGAASVGRMHLAGVDWFAAMRANVEIFGAAGGLGSPDAGNRFRYQLINLAYPLSNLIRSPAATKLLVLCVCAAALAAAMWRARRREGDDDELVALSLIAVASLMIVYHRGYDAVLLVFPLAWSIGRAGRGRVAAWIVLACSLLFVASGPAALAMLERQGRVGESVTGAWWWQTLAIPQQAWALLVMALALGCAGRGQRPESSVQSPESRVQSPESSVVVSRKTRVS